MIKGAADHSEQSTVTELAERLQLAQSTVTELVRRAEETGLVERERSSEDGRIAFLRLTRRATAPGAVVHQQREGATGACRRIRVSGGPAVRILRRFPRDFWVLLAGDGVSHLGYGIFAPYVALRT